MDDISTVLRENLIHLPQSLLIVFHRLLSRQVHFQIRLKKNHSKWEFQKDFSLITDNQYDILHQLYIFFFFFGSECPLSLWRVAEGCECLLSGELQR